MPFENGATAIADRTTQPSTLLSPRPRRWTNSSG
ncbi:hypothetical protein AHiyo8_21320 [Arthrobacter sp. Hiyo8]|nr:hypothetical protein AHiyo8_21320 [Arthrobacter sp. Hiyo8]